MVGQLGSEGDTVQVNHLNTGVAHLELCGPYTRASTTSTLPPLQAATKRRIRSLPWLDEHFAQLVLNPTFPSTRPTPK